MHDIEVEVEVASEGEERFCASAARDKGQSWSLICPPGYYLLVLIVVVAKNQQIFGITHCHIPYGSAYYAAF